MYWRSESIERAEMSADMEIDLCRMDEGSDHMQGKVNSGLTNKHPHDTARI